jgi:hypothetical protein
MSDGSGGDGPDERPAAPPPGFFCKCTFHEALSLLFLQVHIAGDLQARFFASADSKAFAGFRGWGPGARAIGLLCERVAPQRVKSRRSRLKGLPSRAQSARPNISASPRGGISSQRFADTRSPIHVYGKEAESDVAFCAFFWVTRGAFEKIDRQETSGAPGALPEKTARLLGRAGD